MTLTGAYRDAVRCGRAPPNDGEWRPNRIMSTAWPLVAALLRGDSALRGIQYCAVGEGEPGWDAAPPATTPDTTRLVREVARIPIAPGDVKYVGATGRAARSPTHRLELAVTVAAAAAPLRLREFGLFGGDATPAPNSGWLINYVIHPRVDLAPGATLTRTIRLSFRPGAGGDGAARDILDIPAHWLADRPAELVDGVGPTVLRALRTRRIATVGQLAQLDLERRPAALSLARAIELREKARLALRTAAQVSAVEPLETQHLTDLLTSGPDARPDDVPPRVFERLQEQLALLQLGLDAQFLKTTTLRELTRRSR